MQRSPWHTRCIFNAPRMLKWFTSFFALLFSPYLITLTMGSRNWMEWLNKCRETSAILWAQVNNAKKRRPNLVIWLDQAAFIINIGFYRLPSLLNINNLANNNTNRLWSTEVQQVFCRKTRLVGLFTFESIFCGRWKLEVMAGSLRSSVWFATLTSRY